MKSCMVLFITCCDNVTGGRWGKPSCFSPRTGWFDKRRRVGKLKPMLSSVRPQASSDKGWLGQEPSGWGRRSSAPIEAVLRTRIT